MKLASEPAGLRWPHFTGNNNNAAASNFPNLAQVPGILYICLVTFGPRQNPGEDPLHLTEVEIEAQNTKLPEVRQLQQKRELMGKESP